MIACLARQVPHLWAERWAQDDAYVSFRYARNLVRGHGLVYNVGEPVEGYTQLPLDRPRGRTARRSAPTIRCSFMHVVSLVLWWASYALLLVRSPSRCGPRACGRRRSALLPLALHWSFNMWFFSGMETPLVTFLTIAAVSAASPSTRAAIAGHCWR